MKITIFLLITLISTSIQSQVKRFEGAWFEIKYPQNFTAKGSLSSQTADGYDSATFLSPDGKVEFYIFSPQWSGKATDILLKSSEKMASTKTTVSGSYQITYWTISAKDGSYTRSYQEKLDLRSKTASIVGLKYSNTEAYNQYKSMYIAFKSSLIQYADK